MPWEPPKFVLTTGPENLERFVAGDLGIILPSYARSYLIVAYREMSGLPLTEAEREGAMRVWDLRLGRYSRLGREGVEAWVRARARVCGGDQRQQVTRSQIVEDPETQAIRYMGYSNCYPDAFETAAGRLDELIEKYGPTASRTLEWLAAQEVVFRNCSGRDAAIPRSLTGKGRRADRDYQIASALFYAGDFGMAEAAFRSIANDPGSRWRILAPYLVVRCLVRRAEFDSANRHGYLAQALVEIDEFLRRPEAKAFRPAGLRMRNIVLRRLDPDRRTPELAEIVAAGQRPDEFADNLWDLTQLLDRYHYYEWGSVRKMTGEILRPDLIAWLRGFQSWGAETLQEALARWHQTGTAPWLLAALAHARGEDAAATELIEAVSRFERRSPAWPTLEYHRLRLLVEQSRVAEARQGLEQALRDPRFCASASAGNLLRELRTRVARNRSDFLEFAVRGPAEPSLGRYGDLGREVRESEARLAETAIVESFLPVSEQLAMLDEPGLDDPTRDRLAAAVWVRALLLHRLDLAREVAPRIQVIVSRLHLSSGETEALQAFAAATTERVAYREATFALLHLPGIPSFLGPRLRSPGYLDHGWSNNWWTNWGDSWTDMWDTMRRTWGVQSSGPAEGCYPSARLRARAEEERRRLASRGSPLTVLGSEILRWAKEEPDEPRMPRMLHDLIVAGRYTTGDEHSSSLLRRAFRLLQTRYQDTKWAADTTYWYEPPRVVETDGAQDVQHH